MYLIHTQITDVTNDPVKYSKPCWSDIFAIIFTIYSHKRVKQVVLQLQYKHRRDQFQVRTAMFYRITYFVSDVEECSSDPCENGGTFIDGINGYSCQCVAGYTGANCETGSSCRFSLFIKTFICSVFVHICCGRFSLVNSGNYLITFISLCNLMTSIA